VWFLGGREWNQRNPEKAGISESLQYNEHLAIRWSDSKVRRPFLICAKSDDDSTQYGAWAQPAVSEGKIHLWLGIPTKYFAEAYTPECTKEDYSFSGYANVGTRNPLPHLSSLFIRNTQLLELGVLDAPASQETPNETSLTTVQKTSDAAAWDSLAVLILQALGYGSTGFSHKLKQFREKTRDSDSDLLPQDSPRFCISVAFLEKRKHHVGRVLQKQGLFSVLDAHSQGQKLEKLGQAFTREEIYHLLCILMTNQHAYPLSAVEQMNHSIEELRDDNQQSDRDSRIHFTLLFGAFARFSHWLVEPPVEDPIQAAELPSYSRPQPKRRRYRDAPVVVPMTILFKNFLLFNVQHLFKFCVQHTTFVVDVFLPFFFSWYFRLRNGSILGI